MLKTLLSLVLATTQLLLGSGSTLYLCLCENGFHCVDFGPASCTCCHSRAEQEEHVDHCGCSESAVKCDGGRAEHSKSDNDNIVSQIVPNDSCGCTHFQITNEQPTNNVRASSATDLERHFQFAAVLPYFLTNDRPFGDRFDPVGSRGSPIIPSQTLIFLSSIVMLC